jgi:Winged helix DNA-binding domain
VAEATCGIHAQVMSTTDVQVWARCSSFATGGVGRALWQERSLVRTWCMRGTLHLLTPQQFALYSAVFDPALQYTPVWYRQFRVTPEEMERLHEALAGALEAGEPMTRRDLAAAVTARAGERLGARLRSSWGELLKPSGRRGLFVNGPNRGQEITYVRADRWLGGALPPAPASADAAAARREWLRRYLGAYGPASEEDYARWLGVRQLGPIKLALAGLGDEAVEVRAGGRRLHALAADVEELTGCADTGAEQPVRLLPGFDPYVLGHADRDHLVDAEHRPLVYRTAGWISPTVLSGGRIVGTWEHRVEAGRLAVQVTPFAALTAAQRAGVQAEAERLAAFFARSLELYT